MAKRRTDIYYDANRLIIRAYKGDNLVKLTRLWTLPADERTLFNNILHNIERILAKKYNVQLDTVKSQTAAIIRDLRAAFMEITL